MLGWMLIFALFAVLGAVLTLASDTATASISLMLASYLFGGLFLVCVVTRVVRGRA